MYNKEEEEEISGNRTCSSDGISRNTIYESMIVVPEKLIYVTLKRTKWSRDKNMIDKITSV